MDKKKLSLIVAVLFLVISLVVFFSVRTNNKYESRPEASQEQANKEPVNIVELQQKVLQPAKLDIVVGDDDAPVTIYEYASYSCSHCSAFFNNIYPQLKKEYADTGKVKFVYRDFPLDEPALRAAQLVHCLPDDNKKSFMKVLFENQKTWAYTKEFPEKLENLAKIAGMSADIFHGCMSNETLEQEVLETRLDVYKAYKVNSTPTLIINGQKYIGRMNWYEISDYINNLLK